MSAGRDDFDQDKAQRSRGADKQGWADSDNKRLSNGGKSGLLSALGPEAVNRRFQNRMLRSTSAPITPNHSDRDILAGLTLGIEQIYAGLLSYDQAFLDLVTKRLMRDEVPFSAFYRQIAVPLAELLGDAWNDDSLSMVDVEFATGRLSLWCDKYASEDPSRVNPSGEMRRIFLARTSGELHTLGLSITSKCYHHAGWQVDGGPEVEVGPRLLAALRDNYYDAVGISVGVSHRAPECATLVSQLRRASCNPKLKIILGGPALVAEPHIFDHVGADFIALDALEAVEVSDQLVQAA
ncbi:MAG: cobalamin B12-binding domain-containing protein [Ahrensia sp.]